MMDNGNHQDYQTTGGLGGELCADGIRDTRLVERALRELWPIDDSKKAAIVEQIVSIAISPESGNREAISAARCLAIMNGQNLAVLHKALDKVSADRHKLEHSQSNVQFYIPTNRRGNSGLG